jgi:N utilization substance protein A
MSPYFIALAGSLKLLKSLSHQNTPPVVLPQCLQYTQPMNADSPEALEIRKLFEQRVPSIASGVVTIRGIARESGRSILAVASTDPATDAVGSCVGMRGAIVKAIMSELRGEHIDIVLWNDSAKQFLSNLFAPMRFQRVSFDETSHQATAVLREDSELASSKKVALRSRLFRDLTGWVLQFSMES